jgi:transposase
VRETIEAAGAELRYLPPYSPDLNPIENVYSKLKSDLRRGAAHRRCPFQTRRPQPESHCAVRLRWLLQTCRLSCLIQIKWNLL